MKIKSLILLLFLVSSALLTSCQSTEMQTQEMPLIEETWAETLMNWYPNWNPPIIIQQSER